MKRREVKGEEEDRWRRVSKKEEEGSVRVDWIWMQIEIKSATWHQTQSTNNLNFLAVGIGYFLIASLALAVRNRKGKRGRDYRERTVVW